MAEYCLKMTASDNDANVSQETVDALCSSFYVDDGLISCSSVEEGKKCVSELFALLHSGGFELKKFVSENMGILNDVDPERLLKYRLLDLLDH